MAKKASKLKYTARRSGIDMATINIQINLTRENAEKIERIIENNGFYTGFSDVIEEAAWNGLYNMFDNQEIEEV